MVSSADKLFIKNNFSTSQNINHPSVVKLEIDTKYN